MSEESTVTSEEPVKPSITLQDIASVVEILKVCTDRGVWRISELSTVGQLYERLVAFLEGAGIAVNASQAEKE